MKKLFMVLLVLFTTAAHSRNDGNWWNANSDLAKSFYMSGYVSGMVSTAFYLPAVFCMNQKFVGAALEKCLVDAHGNAQEAVVSPVAGRPFGSFINGVNIFYSDYRNLGVCFKVAVSVVTKEMNGMKQEQVRDWVERVRAIPVTDSCD